MHPLVHLTERSLHIQAGGRLGLRALEQLVERIPAGALVRVCARVSHTA